MNSDMYPRIFLLFQIYHFLHNFHLWLDSVLPPMSMSVLCMTVSGMGSMRMTMGMMCVMTTT